MTWYFAILNERRRGKQKAHWWDDDKQRTACGLRDTSLDTPNPRNVGSYCKKCLRIRQ